MQTVSGAVLLIVGVIHAIALLHVVSGEPAKTENSITHTPPTHLPPAGSSPFYIQFLFLLILLDGIT